MASVLVVDLNCEWVCELRLGLKTENRSVLCSKFRMIINFKNGFVKLECV